MFSNPIFRFFFCASIEIFLSSEVIFAQSTPQFNYPVSPDTVSVCSESVGSPIGSFNVTDMGGATYSIAIEAPQGLPDAQPQIAIIYNSQARNGIAGYGCSISGVSAITRGSRDIYHDGQSAGMDYSKDDAFYLDGQRMIRLTYGEGNDSAVYCLESQPYVRIVAHAVTSQTGSGLWFHMITQDGIRYEYGTVAASVHSDSNSASNYADAWYVTKMVCPTGNYIEYGYFKDNLYVYPSYVLYGQNERTSNPLSNRIDFIYEDRSDIQLFSVHGNKGSLRKRLKEIKSSSNSVLYRKYNLSYDSQSDGTTTAFSRLISVTETNKDGESIKPTTLSWQYLPSFSFSSHNIGFNINQTESMVTTMIPGTSQLYAADLNGDGISDIINKTKVNYRDGAIYEFTAIYKYLSHFGNNGEIFYDSIPSTSFLPVEIPDWNYWTTSPLICDFNGDGRNDFFVPYFIAGSGVRFYYFDRGISYGHNINDVPAFDYIMQNQSNVPIYACCDFDKDGRSDLIILETAMNGNGYNMCICIGCGDITTMGYVNMNVTILGQPKKIFTSDYNNDGLPDILVVHDNGYRIFWNQGGGINSTTFTEASETTDTYFGNAYRLYEGDFNSDGLADYLVTLENNPEWFFCLGNGDGTFTHKTACNLSDVFKRTGCDEAGGGYFTCFVHDMDADGKSDVFISKAKFSSSNSFQQVNTYWLTSTGDSLIVKQSQTSGDIENASINYSMLGDFNGDGLLDVSNYGYNYHSGGNRDNTLRNYTLQGYSPNAGKIRSITNGYGKQTKIEYGTLTSPSVYQKDNYATYPVIDCTPPMHVVTEVADNPSTVYADTVKYSYGKLKFHVAGKGLLGFGTSITDDRVLSTYSIRNVTLNMGNYTPSCITETRYVGTDNATSETNFGYVQPHNGLKSFCFFPISSFETDLDGNEFNKTFTYDQNKNYTLSESQVSHTGGFTKTIYQSFVKRYETYLPTLTIKQTQYTGQSIFTERKETSYNNIGQITSKVERANTGHAVTTEFVYDNFGNIASSTVSTQDGEFRPTTYQYDSTHRFITMQTELTYKKTLFTYDLWGNVLTKSDNTHPSHPLTTTYTYDGWNNLKAEHSYTGQQTTYIRGWNSSGNSFLVTQGTGMPWRKECYDILGKKISTQTISVLDLPIEEYYHYGTRGELLSHTKVTGTFPDAFFDIDNKTYDYRKRVTSVRRSGQPNIYFSYAPNSVTSTKNELVAETQYDLWGNIINVTDNAGTLTYQYGSHGKPISATFEGNTVSMTYDALGRKISMTDPDAGQMIYSYDDFDRVKTERDALNHLTQNTYNSDGLLTASTTDGVATTYTYGQSSDNRFLLLSSTRENCAIRYAYDNYGRVSAERRVFGTEDSVEVHFSYNSIGQVLAKEYVGGPTISYTYDAYGYKNEVKANDILISQPLVHTYILTSEKRGAHLKARATTDGYGRIEMQEFRKNDTPNSSHSLFYTYDDYSGNMDSREGMFPRWEEFVYDDMDRLTGVNCDRQYRTEYAPNGNITYKTGIGHYYYEGTKPHAVTLVENTEGRIQQSTLETSFNPFGKIQSINLENSTPLEMTFTYGPDNERWQTILRKNGNVSRKTYYFGDSEKIVASGRTRSLYYLDGGAIYVKQTNCPDSIYFTFTDHLGSIVAIVDYNGNELFKASYDAWGNQTVYNNSIDFHRGYCGHEMLPNFGLINMNGRLYDPLLGRFLSTDNFVQEPYDSQNFNRYSYCLNNPLKYTDPSGEFFFGTILNALKDLVVNTFVNVWTQGINAWTNADNWHSTYMSWKIDTGLFKGSPSQILSRFTWEAPQTLLGYTSATIQNTFNGVKSVSHYDGATAVETYSEKWGAFTLGSYIIGERGLYADPSNSLFQHEYGHYLQSQSFGPFYLQRCAIPSLFDTLTKHHHNNHPVEQDANIRAFKYFHEHENGFGVKNYPNDIGWDMEKNRILGYRSWLDYYNPINQAALRNTLSLGWPDYVLGATIILPGLIDNIVLHQ